ncbi:uncharacterized protein [Leptinotarsa decemlineata]|uniref:uncharacterized protein n=1 Tax=Leptinotarsa decemlineata TaxID=7539 RepID=UPI003D30856A
MKLPQPFASIVPLKMRLLLVLIVTSATCCVFISGQKDEGDRQVLYKPSLIAILSRSDKAAVVVDYTSEIIAVFNGKQGTIIVVNISEKARYHLKSDNDDIWPNFDDYFQKLSSLQSLLKIAHEMGQKSSLDMLEEPVEGELKEVFNDLGGSLPLPQELALLEKFIRQLNGCLGLVYKGSGSFKIASSVDGFLNVNLAIAKLLEYSEGKLNEGNINFDASQIFRAESGAEVLLNVLAETGLRSDLIELFGNLAHSPEKVLSLLKQASSGSHEGVDGLITILVDYTELHIGKGDAQELINAILNYNSRVQDSQDLGRLVNETLTVLENQDRVFHNAPGFSIYLKLLRGYINNEFVLNNISLNDLVLIFTSRSNRDCFKLIAKLLSNINPARTTPGSFSSSR